MRYSLIITASLALAACSDAAQTTDAEESDEASSDQAAADDASQDANGVPGTNVTLPLDLPLAPESYVLDNDINEYDFQGTPMAQFRLDSRKPSADVLAFYSAALETLDFEIASMREDEGGGSLRATRADGAQVQLHSINEGSSVADGESGTTFTVTFGTQGQ